MSENVYDKARQVLRERGWRQGTVGRNADGPVCALGAVARATGVEYDGDVFRLYHASEPHEAGLLAVIEEQYPGADGIANWNDEPGRTAIEVDAVLDKAARAFDEQVQP